jgi:hypothetical protein
MDPSVAHREWLLEELGKDGEDYLESVRRGDPNLRLNGRIDARLLDGRHLGLLTWEHEDELRTLYLKPEPLTEELDT